MHHDNTESRSVFQKCIHKTNVDNILRNQLDKYILRTFVNNQLHDVLFV